MTDCTALQALRADLNARFPERKEVIDGTLAAVLAGEHVLLLGPPGTAKSALVRAVAQAFQGRYFERLLTKYSTPEELFGPISLKALEQDRFARITSGKLPEAEFAFADEVFKANSAILNTLLAVMNERLFHNDGSVTSCPLVTLFGASNELPQEKEELEALFDRFLLRYEVQYLLRPAHLRQVLLAPDPAASPALSMAELRLAQVEREKVVLTDETVDALIAIREDCKREGIVASDRRWKKALKLAQATALFAGEAATAPEDLVVLTDSLWQQPSDRPKVARLVGKIADPVSAKALEILDAARETAAQVQAVGTGDRKLFIAKAAQAIDDFNAQQAKLKELTAAARRRSQQTVADVTQEIQQLHTELARQLSGGLRLAGAGAAR